MTRRANGAVNSMKRVRSATTWANNLATSFVVTEVDETSVLCIKIQEFSGTCNRTSFHVIHKGSGRSLRLLSGVASRTCDACLLREQFCSCTQSREFAVYNSSLEERVRRRKVAFDRDYIKSWLQGAWIASLTKDTHCFLAYEVLFYTQGAHVDKAFTEVLQAQTVAVSTPYQRISTKAETAQAETAQAETAQAETAQAAAVLQLALFLDRPHVCSICCKAFKQACHLREHLRCQHGGSGAFTCKLCGKDFGVRSKLKRHTECVHVQLRPYECVSCEKRYKDKSYLRQHEVTHQHIARAQHTLM